MALGHEKLDVYPLPIDCVGVQEKAGILNRVHREARDQWFRASQSIPLNLDEGYGNGKNDFDSDSDFDLDKEQPLRPY
jgi:hypothetical protein